jgi:hypothetical protein
MLYSNIHNLSFIATHSMAALLHDGLHVQDVSLTAVMLRAAVK